MIQDEFISKWSGEVNDMASMTEQTRIYSIQECLYNPSLILKSRPGAFSDRVDPDQYQEPQDVPDEWDVEVPRDPDYYTNVPRKVVRPKPSDDKPDEAKPRPQSPSGNVETHAEDEEQSDKDE